jgi:hypothetical protein
VPILLLPISCSSGTHRGACQWDSRTGTRHVAALTPRVHFQKVALDLLTGAHTGATAATAATHNRGDAAGVPAAAAEDDRVRRLTGGFAPVPQSNEQECIIRYNGA